MRQVAAQRLDRPAGVGFQVIKSECVDPRTVFDNLQRFDRRTGQLEIILPFKIVADLRMVNAFDVEYRILVPELQRPVRQFPLTVEFFGGGQPLPVLGAKPFVDKVVIIAGNDYIAVIQRKNRQLSMRLDRRGRTFHRHFAQNVKRACLAAAVRYFFHQSAVPPLRLDSGRGRAGDRFYLRPQFRTPPER